MLVKKTTMLIVSTALMINLSVAQLSNFEVISTTMSMEEIFQNQFQLYLLIVLLLLVFISLVLGLKKRGEKNSKFFRNRSDASQDLNRVSMPKISPSSHGDTSESGLICGVCNEEFESEKILKIHEKALH